jgi:microcystin-dependent protein
MGLDPFLGEIQMFAGNYAPTGWALCDGQLLSIAQNTALFSLLGTTYGGNGTTTFALPDLRGRVPIQPGQGPGLTQRDLGEVGGTETLTLNANQIPAHTHTAGASTANGVADGPSGRVPARMPGAIPQYAAAGNADMAAAAVGNSGGGQPHNNMQPYLTITYIIALQGVYPQRP